MDTDLLTLVHTRRLIAAILAIVLLAWLAACSFSAPVTQPTATVTLPTATRAPTLTPLGMNIPTLTPAPPGNPTATRVPTSIANQTLTRAPTRPSATDIPSPKPASSSDFFAAGMRERKNGYYDRAIAAFQTVLAMKPTTDLARDAQFRIAETYVLAGDDAHAISALVAYLQSSPNAAQAPQVHYWLAGAYSRKGNDGNALGQMQIYRGQTQALAGDTDAAIGDILSRAGNSAEALSYYDRALQDTTLAAATRASILTRTATVNLLRGEGMLAGTRFDAALALASDAKTRASLNWNAGQAYAAANRMDLATARWTTAITDTPEQPGAQQALTELLNRKIAVDDYRRGLVEYNSGDYAASTASFQRFLKNPGTRAGLAHYWLGRSFAKQGAITQATAEYDTIISTMSQDSALADAIIAKGDVLETAGKIDQAVEAYRRLAAMQPNSPRAAEALLDAGLALERVKRYRDAVAIFEQLQNSYATRDPDRAAEGLFRAGLDYYRLRDYTNAVERWTGLTERYPQSDFYTAGLYWLGKVGMERGQTDAAKGYWAQAEAVTREVFKSYRRNYYAFRARSALNPNAGDSGENLYAVSRYSMDGMHGEIEAWLKGWTRSAPASPGELDPAVRADMNFRRGDELLRLGRMDEAHLELSALVDRWQENPWAMYALALYFQDQSQYDFVIACAIRLNNLALEASAPPAPRGMDLLRYPAYYVDLVVAESKANALDPRLYFAFIRLESRFNPRNTGPVGERGLTQINPQMAPAIAAGLKMPDVTPDQLYLPYIGLKFGAWLFAQNAKQLDDPIYTFAAYNAGLGRAMGWQAADVDLALEEFDIEDARTYVFIVYPYWQEYLRLY